jgi:hypothetical protein
LSKQIDSFRLPPVRFLCEQKGPTETILTAKFSQDFVLSGLVLRAYLVRVAYANDPSAASVVLAVRTKGGGEERTLLPGINTAFASIFGSHEHLDILFVREEQEREIGAVCAPFYSASSGGNPLC